MSNVMNIWLSLGMAAGVGVIGLVVGSGLTRLIHLKKLALLRSMYQVRMEDSRELIEHIDAADIETRVLWVTSMGLIREYKRRVNTETTARDHRLLSELTARYPAHARQALAELEGATAACPARDAVEDTEVLA